MAAALDTTNRLNVPDERRKTVHFERPAQPGPTSLSAPRPQPAADREEDAPFYQRYGGTLPEQALLQQYHLPVPDERRTTVTFGADPRRGGPPASVSLDVPPDVNVCNAATPPRARHGRPSLHIQTEPVQVHRYSASHPSPSSASKTTVPSPHIIEINPCSTGSSSASASDSARAPLRPAQDPKSPKRQRGRNSAKKRATRLPSVIPQTPIRLPRRLSRFPSFFTRESRLLPHTFRRRDAALLAALLATVLLFFVVGVLCEARADLVCATPWLAAAVNDFLPDLVLGGPYTALVVGVAVSPWGRRELRGHWTPVLYAATVSVGRVAVQSLMGNLTWTVLRC